jgi:two-component system sensor histidine kinase YesM
MRGSIKQRLLVMISILIFMSVITVTVLTYQNYRADLVEQGTQTTRRLLEQLAINVDSYLDELYRLCLSPYYSKHVMEQLEVVPATPAGKLEKRRTIENYLTEVMMLPRSDILRAHILSDEIYSSSKTRYSADIPQYYQTESWYMDALGNAGTTFIPAHLEMQGRTTLSVFGVAKRINSTRDNSKLLGVIRVDASYNGIKSVCDRIGTQDGNALLILDNANNLIYRSDKTGSSDLLDNVTKGQSSGLYTLKTKGETYFISTQSLTAADWRIIDVHSMRSMTGAATLVRDRAYLLAFLCAALGVLVTVPLVRRFLKPVFHITDVMQKAQSGDFSVRVDVRGNDEIAYLARSFNDMVKQIDSEIVRNNLLTRQIYEARYLEKEAQYAALCNQIRPHFLFNALNTIHLLIKTGRGDEAVKCINMLAVLLRGMVNSDREITLRAEMKIVESYLTLQQKRYGSLSYSLPDITNWEEYLLPAFTLQPLVENALVHGCELKRGQTRVEITIQETGGDLQVTVSDNGIGMSEQTLEGLREALAAPSVEPTQSEKSVGLVNIARRVKLIYGEAYGLTLSSIQGEGTTVTLRLPKEGGKSCIGR